MKEKCYFSLKEIEAGISIGSTRQKHGWPILSTLFDQQQKYGTTSPEAQY